MSNVYILFNDNVRLTKPLISIIIINSHNNFMILENHIKYLIEFVIENAKNNMIKMYR